MHYLGTLAAELQDLKRIQPAHYERSIASQLFVECWHRLIQGEAAEAVALDATAKAILHVLLPGCDDKFFRPAGLGESYVTALFEKSLKTTASERIAPELLDRLRDRLPQLAHEATTDDAEQALSRWALVRTEDLPDFVGILCRQPRAGATAPGKPRLVLLPPEMHSDHCMMTAIYAVLFSPEYGAEIGKPFLAALAHHLQNAYLPDCGFAGELMMWDRLPDILANTREAALAQLAPDLRERTREALRVHETIATPDGEAISAGDVIDRVLDVKWRTRAAAVVDADILDELDLVHEGPLKTFQMNLLNKTQLWSTPSRPSVHTVEEH